METSLHLASKNRRERRLLIKKTSLSLMFNCIFKKMDGATFSWVFSFLALSENKQKLKITIILMQR